MTTSSPPLHTEKSHPRAASSHESENRITHGNRSLCPDALRRQCPSGVGKMDRFFQRHATGAGDAERAREGVSGPHGVHGDDQRRRVFRIPLTVMTSVGSPPRVMIICRQCAAARARCGSAAISAGVMETSAAASCALRMSVSTSTRAWMNSEVTGNGSPELRLQ